METFNNPQNGSSGDIMILDAKWIKDDERTDLLARLPAELKDKAPAHVFIRTSLGKNELDRIKTLISSLGWLANTTAVITSRDIEKFARVRRSLSLEAAVEDIRDALLRDSELRVLREFAGTLVSLDGGCTLFQWESSSLAVMDVFYRLRIDADALDQTFLKWRVPGSSYLVSVAAMLAKSIEASGASVSPLSNRQVELWKKWLSAVSRLHEHGFVFDKEKQHPDLPWCEFEKWLDGEDEAHKHGHHLASPKELKKGLIQLPMMSPERAKDLANEVLMKGLDVLSKNQVPILHLGDCKIVDRRERDQVRVIQGRLREYAVDALRARRPPERPLSMAVFGPPGCGKSFLIKQIANTISTGRPFEPIVFNLTQFSEPRDLWVALHRVRDIALSDKIPLVFWDEFDHAFGTTQLGWLRFFLAPMEDRSFFDERIEYHIGASVFVFAGGTQSTFDDFAKAAKDKKSEKAPDFLSRLTASLDVLGTENRTPGSAMRRALILRAELDQRLGENVKVDADMAKYLLGTSSRWVSWIRPRWRARPCIQEYKNGARSLRTIASLMNPSAPGRLRMQDLPPESLLAMQVVGDYS
ncbi:MAG: ATP-binding protein [Gammaproteobacteria bacterium]